MNVTFGSLSSLQTQIQLLSPLTSCFASILNSKRTTLPKASRRSESQESDGKKKSFSEESVNYYQSLDSTLNSFNELLCDKNSRKLLLKKLQSFETSDKNCVKNILTKHLINKIIINSNREPLPWVVSHKSHWSFDDNKYYRNGTTHKLLGKWMIKYNYCPNRTFKSRSQPFTGIGNAAKNRREMTEQTSIGHKKLGSIFGLKKDKNISQENEKMKELLNEENIETEDKNKIKIAFAEGYLAAEPKTKTSSKMKFFNVFRDLMGIVLIIAILFSFMGEISGGSFRRVLIGGTNEVHPEDIDVTFDDVKGVEEAKQELQEIVEFLRDPEKFSILGGKLPKGVLLVGPPGTGKTLLARAVAGEAGVPFFHAAGPEFDEILVGQGARRVRDLFSTAKLKAPCVVFIDEIDSVGAKRSNSVLHPYANQTINQLLTEMDGFRQNEGVIVLGATNRRDDLDKALLRPGRFDVEVQVPVPDFGGRKEILDLYLSKVKYSNDVNVDMLSRGTTGFTGADLENMVNQAALRAAIDGQPSVDMIYLENSRDKILMGPERKSRIPDEEANVITAYHEGGHALVAHFTKDAHPLHKVTIVPRGPSLGHTAQLPDKEQFYRTKSQLLAQMDTLMGGRAAEELIFGTEKVTTGAHDDLRKASTLATLMVKDYGMSDKIGVRTFEENNTSLVVVNDLAVSTSECIDSEIRKLLQDSYERAKTILKTHSKEHRLLAEALLKYETLNADDVKEILNK